MGNTKNNNSEKVTWHCNIPFTHGESYMSDVNAIPATLHTAPSAKGKVEHIMSCNVEAQLQHKEQHERYRCGDYSMQMPYDAKQHEYRHRFHEQYAKRGQSTFTRSKDGIVGG
jgi:hypothetical protein